LPPADEDVSDEKDDGRGQLLLPVIHPRA